MITHKILVTNEVDNISNRYFCPKLFKIIVDKLHILPLWTGILFENGIYVLDKKNQLSNTAKIRTTTSLSNNYVENRFGFIKNAVMMKSKPVMPSDLIPKLYNDIKVSVN